MKEVKVEIKRSDGVIFKCGTGCLWRIPSDGLTGIDAAELELFTENKGVGSGTRITGKRVGARTIKLKAVLEETGNNEVRREEVISFFNPMFSFDVYVTYMGKTRWIASELDGFSCPSINVYQKQKMTAMFYCADPYFKSISNSGMSVSNNTPGIAFPYISVINRGYSAAYKNSANELEFINDGDVESICNVRIMASGTVQNPKIILDGKNYILLNVAMQENDVIEIDFTKRKVRKNGENIIQKVVAGSTFFNIAVGKHMLSYAADSGDSYMKVELFYNNMYLGV